MRREYKCFGSTAIIAAAAALFANPATAALIVSAAPTQNVMCSAGVCTATAQNAVLNNTELAGMLASTDVTIRTANVTRNIYIKGGFSWVSANRLTLDAHHSIAFERAVEVTGPGALTLTTNDGGTGGTLSFAPPGRIHFWDVASSLVINGASYTLVADLETLASDIAANPAGDYALADNYDATSDGTYTQAPIPTSFAGNFQGLGNTISHLTISNTVDTGQRVNLGLFAILQDTGSIQNVRLTPARVTGGNEFWVAGLVTVNAGYLFGNFVRGQFSGGTVSGALVAANHGTILSCGADGSISAPNYVGGLVGQNYRQITASFASTVLKSGGYYGGGLVGMAVGGGISDSHASGAVEGSGVGSFGGLVGFLQGLNRPASIINSYATGNISGGDYAGGLIGDGESYARVSITHSHATGNVTSFNDAGGLIGFWEGGQVQYFEIADSYATGNIQADVAGGLAGHLQGANVSRSFASGVVTGISEAGGLVGTRDSGVIGNTYSVSPVSASGSSYTNVGGLVGSSTNTTDALTTSYAIGAVTGGTCQGGFVGNRSTNEPMSDDYWDTTTSGTNNGVGCGDASGITGLTTEQLRSGLPAGFDPAIWSQAPGINNGFPYLISNPPA